MLNAKQLQALSFALEVSDSHQDDEKWEGFSWQEVRTATQTLNTLIIEGYIYENYRSRQYVNYKLVDVEKTRKLLDIVSVADAPELEELVVPNDLFDVIVGHDATKKLFNLSIQSDRPVHILLVGEPATAKSLFLDEAARLPGSRFALGSTTSNAGLVDFLIEARPRYLCLDEIDKMPSNDLAALLTLMESGRVSRLKRNMREDIHLDTWVFAGANSIGRLQRPLLSRFLIRQLQPYSESEFKSIAKTILTTRERVDPVIAEEIIRQISFKTKDPRDATKVGRLVHSLNDVTEIVNTIWS